MRNYIYGLFMTVSVVSHTFGLAGDCPSAIELEDLKALASGNRVELNLSTEDHKDNEGKNIGIKRGYYAADKNKLDGVLKSFEFQKLSRAKISEDDKERSGQQYSMKDAIAAKKDLPEQVNNLQNQNNQILYCTYTYQGSAASKFPTFLADKMGKGKQTFEIITVK